MIGTTAIARGGTDAPVLLADQVIVRELFGLAIAPIAAGTGVEPFRESLGEAVGERLHQDGGVVIMAAFEIGDQRFEPQARRHSERPNVVFASTSDGSNEV